MNTVTAAGHPDPRLGHGHTLSRVEYERRIVDLNQTGSGVPSRQQDLKRRRTEFDLLVDYRLGSGFPADRREALWSRLRALDRRRPWHLLLGLIVAPGDPSRVMVHAQVKTVSKLLNSAELAAFFDLRPDQIEALR